MTSSTFSASKWFDKFCGPFTKLTKKSPRKGLFLLVVGWRPNTWQGVSDSVTDVTRAAQETGVAATQLLASASALAKQSEVLRDQVSKFLSNVRAA